MSAKKYFVVRGGRNIAITADYQQAMLIARNNKEWVNEFENYHSALKMLVKMAESALAHSRRPSMDNIFVDASVNQVNGHAEFRVMHGRELVYQQKNLYFATPNIAEYLAIYHAVRYCLRKGTFTNIYCDNIAAVNWVKEGAKVVIPPTIVAANNKLVDIVSEANQYIMALSQEAKDRVIFWDKSMWGENPSDYGRKQKRI